MSGQIIAINSKGQKKTFSQTAWNLLGKNKGDWKEIGSQTVANTVENKAPDMGPRKVKTVIEEVSNKVIKEKTPAEIEEEKRVEAADIKFNGGSKGPSEAQQAEFMEAIKGLTKGAIKDFLDKEDIEYENGKLPELKETLAKHFRYDLVEFQKKFN